jgi:hypothetical protein
MISGARRRVEVADIEVADIEMKASADYRQRQ